MKHAIHALAASLALVLGASASRAEDIDLFVQPGGSASAPNVLIILDNTANWTSAFPFERTALIETVNSLMVANGSPAKVRLGIMMFSESGGQNKGEDGGYVRSAIRDFSGDYQTKFVNLVNSIDIGADKSNGGKAGKAMADAYAYFAGRPPLTGNNKVKTDYAGNTSGGTTQSNAIYALPGNALNAFLGSPYNSPVADGACGGNYIIYISNNAAQDNNADITTSTGWLSAAATAAGITGATAEIPVSPSGSMTNVADEWARFMRKSPQAIKVYTLDVYEKSTGQQDGWSAVLASMSKQSEGEYYLIGRSSAADAAAKFKFALGDIFSKIQSVNSAFASVSLPVSINTQGTYLNQVFIGMFRPSPDAMPRWDGNLKQYKLGFVGTDIRLVDADGKPAINTNTGFVTECARSFWTPSAIDAYWSFRRQGECLAVANSDASNYPDGRVAEKGGQAYRLRSAARTRMTTCVPFSDCNAGPLESFSTSNSDLSAPLLGVDTAERTTLINWAIGANNKPVDTDGVKDSDDDDESGHNPRPSIHGDVVHSRPVAIDFGTSDESKIVVFYAANDGVLRAVNGNREDAVSGVAAGGELWSFMPPQFVPHIKRLRDNNIEFDFEGSTNDSALPKPYGIDGPITTYRSDNGQETWLFATMRRGGRAVFAFDVSDLTEADGSPTTPTLKWALGCPDNFPTIGAVSDTGCTTGASDIGQTWSAAIVAKLQGRSDPILVMGGGYDTCEDGDPDTCTSSVKGNGVYLIDADSGEILTKLATDRPVVGDVAVIRNSQTGNAMWAYAADLGGNVYRISGSTANQPFGATNPENWTITKIASLGCSSASTGCDGNRKFMFMPGVVEKNGTYYLLLGSGDREKPLRNWTTAYNTTNYFFSVIDSPTVPTWLTDENANCSAAMMCLSSLLRLGNDAPDADRLAAKKGWYLPLHAHEQVVSTALTIFGTTTFNTHTPVPEITEQCAANLGIARAYNVSFFNGAPPAGQDRYAEIPGGGLAPSPVGGMVLLDGDGDGEEDDAYAFQIGGCGGSSLEACEKKSSSAGTQPKSLTYWFIEKK